MYICCVHNLFPQKKPPVIASLTKHVCEGLVLYMQRILSDLMRNRGTQFIGLNIKIL